MRRLLTILASGSLLGIVLISVASAAVPSPANSGVPPCFVGCPFGDISFAVTVRDYGNNPQAGAYVVLDFSSCPEVSFCATQEPGTTINGSYVNRLADNSGVAVFHLRAGGLCPSGSVPVYADGVLLADRRIVSTDQDGNLKVDATDQSMAEAKVGGSDLSADFDCDGDVDQTDLNALSTHQGHACDLTTPAAPRSWGYLKVIYR